MENLGNLTSILTAILMPLMAMLGVAEATQSLILSLVAGIVALIVWYLDIRYKSNYFIQNGE